MKAVFHIVLASLAAVAALVVCYAPAFAITALLRPVTELAVAVVVAGSAALALGVAFIGAGTVEVCRDRLGLRPVAPAQLGRWLLWSALAAGALFCAGLFGREPVVPAIAAMAAASQLILIVMLVSSQEELIFRGLILDMLRRSLGNRGFSSRAAAVSSVLIAGALFGAVHSAIGPITVAMATLLGLIAGAARVHSGSIVPAIGCHVVFNLAAWVALQQAG